MTQALRRAPQAGGVDATLSDSFVALGRAARAAARAVALASTDAKFGFVFARRRIALEACSSWFLPRLVGPPTAVRQLAGQFRVPAGGALEGLDPIYLVDPLGNFMLHYPPDADASGMRKDLVRLLKVSQVG